MRELFKEDAGAVVILAVVVMVTVLLVTMMVCETIIAVQEAGAA